MPGVRVEEVSFAHGLDPIEIGDIVIFRQFTARFSRGYELEIELIDGRPECVAIRNPNGITATRGLRDDLGNLAELVKTAAAWASNPAGENQLRPLRRSDLARAARRLGKRGHYDDAYHRRVLDAAADAKTQGWRQDEWVMRQLGLRSMATARTHISRARTALGER
jgi:hypothetical protein